MPYKSHLNARGSLSVEQTLTEAIQHHQNGRLVDAECLYRDVIKLKPQHVSALYRLGVLYFTEKRLAEAIPLLQQASSLHPQNSGILNTLGVALQLIGRDREALTCLQKSLEINPHDLGAVRNLGRALREQRQNEAAIACFHKIMEAEPNRLDTYLELAKCYFELERFEEAIHALETILTIKPDHSGALSALSSALWAIGRRMEARDKLEQAIKIHPHDAKIILNFGEFLAFDEGKIDEALHYFERSLTLAPDYKSALWRKSFALLAKGQYREGWKLYAACLGDRETRGFNKFAPIKPWDGRPHPEKHLLIWCEQGLGDSLQFVRYAALCKERMGKVSAFCQKPLVRLFKALPFIDDAADYCARDSFDEHIPMMNLPYIFDTNLENIPSTSYLQIDQESKTRWSDKVNSVTKDNSLKVGLVWAGGAHEDNVSAKITDRQRSVKLELMKPWLSLPGAQFFSLQMDKPSEEMKQLELGDRLTHFMDEVTDFADTAAIVENLDLIISVDTSVAHLAGGLGKPVWIMSRYNADWRWLQNRELSPWYPSARIFGQPTMGDWSRVADAVEKALIIEIDKKRRSHLT